MSGDILNRISPIRRTELVCQRPPMFRRTTVHMKNLKRLSDRQSRTGCSHHGMSHGTHRTLLWAQTQEPAHQAPCQEECVLSHQIGHSHQTGGRALRETYRGFSSWQQNLDNDHDEPFQESLGERAGEFLLVLAILDIS